MQCYCPGSLRDDFRSKVSSQSIWSSLWRRVPIGRATSSYPSSHVQLLCFRPLRSARRSASISSIKALDTVSSTGRLMRKPAMELDPEELEAVAIESKSTIDIDEFVPKDEINELYLDNPYYIAPDGQLANRHSPSFEKPSARRAW